MEVILNIEYPPGISMVDKCLEYVKDTLHVKDEDVVLKKHYNCSWFWICKNVDMELYLTTIKEINVHFTAMYNKGYLQYFYIGENVNTL